MAIDSVSKRFSIMNVSCPWRQTIPVPDGSFNQGDRQQLQYMYSGIAAGVLQVFIGGASQQWIWDLTKR